MTRIKTQHEREASSKISGSMARNKTRIFQLSIVHDIGINSLDLSVRSCGPLGL